MPFFCPARGSCSHSLLLLNSLSPPWVDAVHLRGDEGRNPWWLACCNVGKECHRRAGWIGRETRLSVSGRKRTASAGGRLSEQGSCAEIGFFGPHYRSVAPQCMPTTQEACSYTRRPKTAQVSTPSPLGGVLVIISRAFCTHNMSGHKSVTQE